MRFLKNKIFLSHQYKLTHENDSISPTTTYSTDQDGESLSTTYKPRKTRSTRSRKAPPVKLPREKPRCTKNIVKNYGKTIATFACSSMALPYIQPMLIKEGIKLSDVKSFFKKAKVDIQGIDTFRTLALVMPQDSPLEAKLKVIFQRIGEIFIKFFCVNWIYHSKIRHRQTYLQYRFKILRRLRNPEMFTYLKG